MSDQLHLNALQNLTIAVNKIVQALGNIPLSTANGGTGTTTTFTAGSVVFAGTDGVYTQDNSHLFWDDTNNRLGIGTAAPVVKTQISYDGSTPASALYNATADALLITNSGAGAQIRVVAAGGASGAGLLGLFSRGTLASPTAVAVNDTMISLVGQGYDGAARRSSAEIDFNVDGSVSSGIVPGRLTLWTTNTSGTLAERMRIDSSGNVGIGTTGAVNTLQVAGSIGWGAPVTKTNDFTLGATENWVINNRAATNTVTLPAASSSTGRVVTMSTIQAQTVVSASSNVVPLVGGSAATAILAATAGKWATLVSDGSNWVIMAGN